MEWPNMFLMIVTGALLFIFGKMFLSAYAAWPAFQTAPRREQALQVIRVAVTCIMMVVFVYGIFRFPDAPIRECATGYCGKTGAPHTAAEYHAFRVWEPTFLSVWAAGILIMGAMHLARKFAKRPGDKPVE